jgi:predicted TIM-barrel fold metal-dependent hydrolase
MRQRGAETLATEEPDDLIGHVRVCGGAGWVTTGSTRNSRVDEHSPTLCRMMNDALAESCTRDPDRFKAFAHIPFNTMDDALTELTRALDDLRFAGVLVTSNVGGRYLHTPDFFPFWEEVNRRKVPVFMHPSHSPCYQDDEPPTLLSFPFDPLCHQTPLQRTL